MRITNRMIFDQIVYDLNKLVQNMEKVNETISSGKRINRPSDDPMSLVSALSLKSALSEIDQYKRNIDFGYGWLANVETTIQGSMNLVVRAKEIAAQMSNQTYNQEQREAAATEIGEILKELIRTADTQYQNRYIFAGYKTDTAPYALNDDQSAAIYSGDTNNLEIKIGKNNRMAISQYGSQVFGKPGDTDYAFSVLIRLRDALKNNDVTGIRDELANLDTAYRRMVTTVTKIGAKMDILDMKRNILLDMESTITERLSNLEDTDIVQAISDLNMKQSAYRAALMAAAKVTQLNLTSGV